MPVVFRHQGFRFFFYSNEGDPQEPLHIHVRKGGAETKLWLEPEVGIAEAHGLSGPELRDLLKIAAANKRRIEEYWHEHFDL